MNTPYAHNPSGPYDQAAVAIWNAEIERARREYYGTFATEYARKIAGSQKSLRHRAKKAAAK